MGITATGIYPKYEELIISKVEEQSLFISEFRAKWNTELQTSQPDFVVVLFLFFFISWVVSYQWRIEDKVGKGGQNDNPLVWEIIIFKASSERHFEKKNKILPF